MKLYRLNWMTTMEKTFQTVRDHLGQAFQRAKQVYHGRVKKLQFKVDDLVWFFCPRKWPRLGPKWQLLTTGPWQVERVLNSVIYVDVGVGGETWTSSSDVAVSTSPVAMIAVASQAAPTTKDVATGSEDHRRPRSLSTFGRECRRWEPTLPSPCLKDSPTFPRRVD